MIKKTLLIFVFLGILQIILGGLSLGNFQINTNYMVGKLSILQIILGGIVFWTGLFVYYKSKLRNIYSFIFVLFLNITLMGFESFAMWINIILTIAYVITLIALIALIFKYKKI